MLIERDRKRPMRLIVTTVIFLVVAAMMCSACIPPVSIVSITTSCLCRDTARTTSRRVNRSGAVTLGSIDHEKGGSSSGSLSSSVRISSPKVLRASKQSLPAIAPWWQEHRLVRARHLV